MAGGVTHLDGLLYQVDGGVHVDEVGEPLGDPAEDLGGGLEGDVQHLELAGLHAVDDLVVQEHEVQALAAVHRAAPDGDGRVDVVGVDLDRLDRRDERVLVREDEVLLDEGAQVGVPLDDIGALEAGAGLEGPPDDRLADEQVALRLIMDVDHEGRRTDRLEQWVLGDRVGEGDVSGIE